jgi:uncharacterized membrane protein
MSTRDLAQGIAIGAGLMYVLDPERGRRRRAALRDRATHLVHQADVAAGKTLRDARNRARGVIATSRSRLRHDEADDAVIAGRVRAAIGRVLSHPGSITVEVDVRQVRLTGPILAREVHALISTVEAVRGVRDVIDQLDARDTAEGVPGLQGGSAREPRFELRQRHWSPTARLLTALGGTVITWYARGLPRPLRSPVRLMGMGLLTRAVTNLETKRLVGVEAGRRAVDLHKTMHVAAPVDQVFQFWSHIENFPRFMAHLRDVRRIDEVRSHWVAVGPGGTTFHWDAEITDYEENQRIAWRSAPGVSVENAGIVRFQPENGGTRIDIRLTYNPPAGAVGHSVAALLGVDPKRAMDRDLVRFKSLMEDGKATARGETVLREELVAAENAASTEPSAVVQPAQGTIETQFPFEEEREIGH